MHLFRNLVFYQFSIHRLRLNHDRLYLHVFSSLETHWLNIILIYDKKRHAQNSQQLIEMTHKGELSILVWGMSLIIFVILDWLKPLNTSRQQRVLFLRKWSIIIGLPESVRIVFWCFYFRGGTPWRFSFLSIYYIYFLWIITNLINGRTKLNVFDRLLISSLIAMSVWGHYFRLKHNWKQAINVFSQVFDINFYVQNLDKP